jgi:transposase-like protein
MLNQKRKSAKLKAQIVLELLRGKPIEEVSREYQVTVADLSEWRDVFIKNGEAGFKRQPRDSQVSEYERALGRLQMEIELLKKKENFPILGRGNSYRR